MATLAYVSFLKMSYKLSPSDFAFLYEECKRCFYLKVVHNIYQPSKPMPGIFNQIDSLLKNYYAGKKTTILHPNLPPGIVSYGDHQVISKPIQLPNHKSTCHISGKFDIVVKFEDKTYGIIDFKTGNPKDKYTNLYSRQLHAYAYALEHPAEGELSLYPVTKLGLLYFYPTKTIQTDIKHIAYEADIHWIEIKKDEEGFLRFVDEVLTVLDAPRPPLPSPNCDWCKYINKLKDFSKYTQSTFFF